MKLTKLINKSEIELEKEDLIAEMRTMDPTTSDYTKLLGLVERLDGLEKSKRKVSPDAILTGVFTLLEIGLIMQHERLNVISTKAFQRLTRWRV